MTGGICDDGADVDVEYDIDIIDKCEPIGEEFASEDA